MRVRSRSSNSPTLRDNRAARTLKPASPSWVVRNMACRSLPTSIGFHIYTTLISRRAYRNRNERAKMNVKSQGSYLSRSSVVGHEGQDEEMIA